MHLDRLILRCRSPEKLAEFYREYLHMSVRPEGRSVIVGYGGSDAQIELQPAPSETTYAPAKTDRYWKIGIMVPNLDLAQSLLVSQGLSVSEPHMFEDIGYMCHLEDPEGFQIELLQQTFPDTPKTLGYLLAETVFSCIGQITLRTDNIEADLAYYRDELGMKMLSIQPVRKFGFTLYFLAGTDENPIDADLTSIENRKWLWQRPYTCLELQAFADKSIHASTDPKRAGFAGLNFRQS